MGLLTLLDILKKLRTVLIKIIILTFNIELEVLFKELKC
jgi:hypothetical protein